MNSHTTFGSAVHAPSVPDGRTDGRSVRVISSEALFAGAREIGIEHQGALYRLKITRQGKLILNK